MVDRENATDAALTMSLCPMLQATLPAMLPTPLPPQSTILPQSTSLPPTSLTTLPRCMILATSLLPPLFTADTVRTPLDTAPHNVRDTLTALDTAPHNLRDTLTPLDMAMAITWSTAAMAATSTTMLLAVPPAG